MNENKFLEFGNRIKNIREERGFKQGQLADHIGISRQSMSNYESGKSSPDVTVVVKLAEAFNCTTDYLLGLAEHSNEKRRQEYDEELRILTRSINKLPESLRVDWLELFAGIAENMSQDLQSKVLFHHSVAEFLGELSLLINLSLSINEKQHLGNYTELDALRDEQKRRAYLQQIQNTLYSIENVSYECLFDGFKEKLEITEPLHRTIFQDFDKKIQSKGDV